MAHSESFRVGMGQSQIPVVALVLISRGSFLLSSVTDHPQVAEFEFLTSLHIIQG